MALDLSALNEKPFAPVGPALPPSSMGKPLDIPLADIEEDPDQPRKEFSEEAMEEITASIRVRGVKTPVSIRSHPSKPGKWMLNYGARRYRGSLAAGRRTIPAFVDDAHDDYDQVIENIQRDDLKPMELALFIKKRLEAGDKKQEIAKNLGKDGAAITHYLAMIDPPGCVEEAYRSGKCVSPKTLYELRALYEKYPAQVEAWCVDALEITRKSVADLAADLADRNGQAPGVAIDADDGPGVSGRQRAESGQNRIPGSDEYKGAQESGSSVCGDPESTTRVRKGEDGERDGSPKKGLEKPTFSPEGRPLLEPTRISKPLLVIEYDGRAANVLLNLRPSAPGLIHIRFEDGTGEQEVEARACKISCLTEAP
ncbi:MAG TPA: ParB/RepB/Spo0J family partition protein [Oligoflexus sp.]|uniref:ParB/RepB/Spo0J family partition protein n=1 Tax=Oligoflexus sp. TaxID=1971216 RepID=UPI002D80323A|nr:ParB/RepB/Spo0J family partition protein [Oligoflexus sp.]HET9239191.1 ParB/RepB/Spo0J family partition protein [Oligoflexus sp.]